MSPSDATSTMLIHAASHIHSEWSYDAHWPLTRLAEAFTRRRYSVLLLTEHQNGFDEKRRLKHREACLAASTGKALLVPGIEYSDPSNTIHLLVWGDVPFWAGDWNVHALLQHVMHYGGAAVFAHPSRRNAWRHFEDRWGDTLIGIELWNRKTDGWAPSSDAAGLIEGSGALPFVGLDFHEFRQFFPLATVLDLEPPITEASVVACLRNRRFSSQFLGIPMNIISQRRYGCYHRTDQEGPPRVETGPF